MEIISVFCFTRNRVWNQNKIISATENKLFRNYFALIEHDVKYSHELQ